MEDGDSKNNLEKNFLGKCISETSNVRNVFQPFWVRHNSVLSVMFDREFVECKFNFVLFVGSMFWVGFFITKIF